MCLNKAPQYHFDCIMVDFWYDPFYSTTIFRGIIINSFASHQSFLGFFAFWYIGRRKLTVGKILGKGSLSGN